MAVVPHSSFFEASSTESEFRPRRQQPVMGRPSHRQNEHDIPPHVEDSSVACSRTETDGLLPKFEREIGGLGSHLGTLRHFRQRLNLGLDRCFPVQSLFKRMVLRPPVSVPSDFGKRLLGVANGLAHASCPERSSSRSLAWASSTAVDHKVNAAGLRVDGFELATVPSPQCLG